MSVIVPKCAKAAKDRDEPVKKVRLLDDVILPDPDVKRGTEVYGPDHEDGDVIEVPQAMAERFIRVGVAEAVK